MPPIQNIISLVDNPCNPDSRVMQMGQVLVSAGHTVTVICKDAPGLALDESVNGIRYLRVPMRARLLRPRLGFFKFGAFQSFIEAVVLSLRPTVLHANDLIALPAATRIAAKIGAKVVYDVHDLYLHDHKKRSPFALWHGERVERRGIQLADAVITVSASIADHLQRVYGVPRPDMVMNAPDITALSVAVGRDRSIRRDVGLGPDTPLAIFIGQRHLSRGVETLVRALGRVPELHLALLGHGKRGADANLQAIAAAGGYADRLHILTPVPHDLVTSYIASADFGLVPQYDRCLNIQYSMPHKLFETVFAGLPVAVTDMPEMRGFVEKTGTGLVMGKGGVEEVVAVMSRMISDRQSLRLSAEKVEALKRDYGWPAQAKVLLDVYGRLGAKGKPASPAIDAA